MGEKELYNKVTKILLRIGIPTSSMGFDFLRQAIILCFKRKDCHDNITNVLYPTLAKKFDCNPISVERNIRTVIDNAYKTKGLLTINEFFEIIVYKNNYKPSNAELICLLVEYLNMDKEDKKGEMFLESV